MTTLVFDVPTAWQQIIAGPEASVSLQALSGAVEYRIDASLPVETLKGHILEQPNGHTLSVDSGVNLYVKSIGPLQVKIAYTT